MKIILPEKSQTAAQVLEEINFFMMKRKELIKAIEHDRDFPHAKNYRLLLALPIINMTTKGGIHLATDSMDYALTGNNIGRVVSIGGTVGGTNNNYKDCRSLKIGDYVHYNPHVGFPLNYDGSRFISVTDESILSELFNPTKHTDGIFTTHHVKDLETFDHEK